MFRKRTLRRAVLTLLAGGLVAAPASALGDTSSNSRSPLYHNGFGGPCGGPIIDPGSGISGNAVTHLNPDGTVTINLSIQNGLPNTTYYPNLVCVEFFGALTTNAAGNAAGHFVLPSAPPSFTISLETGGGIDTFASQPMTASGS